MKVLLIILTSLNAIAASFFFGQQGGVTYDPDARDYFSRMSANGDPVAENIKPYVNRFVVNSKRDGTWTNLHTVAPFWGTGTNGAAVYLKYSGSITNVTSYVGLGSADYSASVGFTGDGAKYLDSGVNQTNLIPGGASMWVNGNFAPDATNRLMFGPTTGVTLHSMLYGTASLNRLDGKIENPSINISLSPAGTLSRGLINVVNLDTTQTNVFASKNGAGMWVQAADTFSASSATMKFLGGPGDSDFNGGMSYGDLINAPMTIQKVHKHNANVADLMVGFGRHTRTNHVLKFLPMHGQSLSLGLFSSSGITTTQTNTCTMFKDGAVANAGSARMSDLTELVAASGGNEVPNIPLGNQLAHFGKASGDTTGLWDVLTGSFGASATAYSGLKKGTLYYHKMMQGWTNAIGIGITLFNGIEVPGLAWWHGESDQGTTIDYKAALEELYTDVNADFSTVLGTNIHVPIFLYQLNSQKSGTNRVDMYQYQAWKANPTNIIIACPNYWQPHTDGVHLTTTNTQNRAAYFAKAIWDYHHGGYTPLTPASMSWQSSTVLRVTFQGNVGNLVIDTTLVEDSQTDVAASRKGFEYTDDSSSASLTSVAIASSNQVDITFNVAPTGANKKLRYAWTANPSNANAGPTTGAKGNLRDSETRTNIWGAPLYNWCLAFEESVP